MIDDTLFNMANFKSVYIVKDIQDFDALDRVDIALCQRLEFSRQRYLHLPMTKKSPACTIVLWRHR